VVVYKVGVFSPDEIFYMAVRARNAFLLAEMLQISSQKPLG
jgi:hypothetical protein